MILSYDARCRELERLARGGDGEAGWQLAQRLWAQLEPLLEPLDHSAREWLSERVDESWQEALDGYYDTTKRRRAEEFADNRWAHPWFRAALGNKPRLVYLASVKPQPEAWRLVFRPKSGRLFHFMDCADSLTNRVSAGCSPSAYRTLRGATWALETEVLKSQICDRCWRYAPACLWIVR